MRPGLAAELRPPPPVPSPAHGRLASPSPPLARASTSSPLPGPPRTDSLAHLDELGRQRGPPQLSCDLPQNFDLVASSRRRHTTEADWFRFPAPTRKDALRHYPLQDNAERLAQRRDRPKNGLTRRDFKMLGEWRIGESLGRGTSGHVRLGRNIKTGEFAAIKKVQRVPSNHRFTKCIHREISLMKLVAPHPHVVHLYDVFETPSHFYLVTEYCAEGELFEYLQKHSLSDYETHKLFSQLVSALIHLARFRISHRDVKFENLLLYRDSAAELSIKLSDMGLASFQPEDRLLESSCGSPHYAAPEVLEGIPYEGSLADVWSSGVVLYTMFTRTLPFDDEHMGTLFQRIHRCDYSMPNSITGDARDLIEKCFVVDTRMRISLVGIAGHPYLRTRPFSQGPLTTAAIYPPAPPRAPAPTADEALDLGVLHNLAILLRLDSAQEAEERVRRAERHALRFYTILLGFRQARSSSKSPVQPRSFFDDASSYTLSAQSVDTSMSRTRSLSAPSLAHFPMPPDEEPVFVETGIAERKRIVSLRPSKVQLRMSVAAETASVARSSESSASTTASGSYESVNRDYVFPPPLESLPESCDGPHAMATSAPPNIESFAVRPLPLTPVNREFRTSGLVPLDRTTTKTSSNSGGSRSLPNTPAVGPIDPAFVRAARPPANSVLPAADGDHAVRPRLSMHQRLRSLFNGQLQKRLSVASVPEEQVEKANRRSLSRLGNALVEAAFASPPSTPTVQQHPVPRRSVARQTSEPSRASVASHRPPSLAPSTRSSVLRRSTAYHSFARALKGEPPLSPILSSDLNDFGDMLVMGASESGMTALRERQAAEAAAAEAKQSLEAAMSGMQIYHDLEPPTPRASVLNPSMPASPFLSPLAENVNVASGRHRLLSKASSSILTTLGKPPRRQPLSPRSAQTPVPTVTVDCDPSDPDNPIALVDKLQQYPFRSTSAASSRGNWRRSSLSIRVPDNSHSTLSHSAPGTSRAPRSPRIGGDSDSLAPPPSSLAAASSSHDPPPRRHSFESRSPHSARTTALDSRGGSSIRTSRSGGSSSSLVVHLQRQQRDLELDLKRVALENRLLRSALEDRDDEIVVLRRRAGRLEECVREGEGLVGELSREREELEEKCRRVSWAGSASTAGESSMGPGGRTPSLYSVHSSAGGTDWLGGMHARGRFADEAAEVPDP
ncbi:uncharacterized protein JCM10292_005576 [Rhodotorula paludigena]|uniref:uncharacterized protein n=1 Tax=Rhodotorula paludigena TaxID=86838 RepID=UPI003175AB0A